MARWIHTVSAWVLVTFVVTVLSPHFAWEAVASDAHHEWTEGTGHPDAAAHAGGLPSQDHHDDHACAGHQFGHLPLHFASAILPVPFLEQSALASRTATLHLSGVPETPLRPPRFSPFA